jgi:hypothetical protein
VWQRGMDMAIGSVVVLLDDASVSRLLVTVAASVVLAGFVHLHSPCQHLWSINHWTKAAYVGTTVLSVYTFLNARGVLADDLARYSWMMVWACIVAGFAAVHCWRRRRYRGEEVGAKTRTSRNSWGPNDVHVELN